MAHVAQIDQPDASVAGDLQTFSSERDRSRLSGPAARAFRKLAERWDLGNAEAAALLGVSLSTWDRIKASRWAGELSQDQLPRGAALGGVCKGRHLRFVDSMADRWPKLANRGPIFERLTPIAAMIEGGIPRMLETRYYVDALRGGL